MKVRTDFVTNSSSSSFICCFARIADEDKAQRIIDQNNDIEVYTSAEALEEIERSSWSEWLEWDWAGVNVTPSKEYLNNHKDSRFIVITDSFEIPEDEDGDTNYDVDYDDFDTEAIGQITEENGFAEIECSYGAGRNG